MAVAAVLNSHAGVARLVRDWFWDTSGLTDPGNRKKFQVPVTSLVRLSVCNDTNQFICVSLVADAKIILLYNVEVIKYMIKQFTSFHVHLYTINAIISSYATQ